MSEKTAWFPVKIKPVRPGMYEAREKGTRLCMDVHWRKLTDSKHFDWYVDKGFLGPFHLWECVSHKITSWRGLTARAEGLT
jgi:hypothetical protein